MTAAADLILAPLAAIGAYALAVKAHNAFKFFTTSMPPECFGDYQIGQAKAERGCRDCRYLLDCAAQTSRERVVETNRALYAEVTSAKPTIRITDKMTPEFEKVEPLWNKKDCYATEQDPPLAQRVPNMGGLDSAVPYSGRNYVSDESLVEEMKGVLHYFNEPSAGFFDHRERYNFPMGGELSWDYEGFGRVSADGSIWVAPDERIHTGIVLLRADEMGKAARFGWTFSHECNGDDSHVWVNREIVA